MKNISKAFSGVPVLEDVSLCIKAGSVHSLIGGNGAGKSTLMKILTGVHRHDSGEIIVEGKRVNFRNPADAHNKGIYLVPQEPLLYPYMTVEENVLLGMEGKKSELRERLSDLMKALSCDFKMSQMAGELTIAKQQLTELLRGLIRENRVIILDEPTSALTTREVDSLFKNVRRLKKEKNVGFVYITHRMNEIFELSDELTILKDRKVAASGSINDYTLDDVLNIMVPDVKTKLKTSDSKSEERVVSDDAECIFSVNNLGGKGFFDVSFNLKKGEILGLTGVVGAGRTEFAESVFGLTKQIDGSMEFMGKKLKISSPIEAINQGIVYVPEDRRKHGGFLNSSINDNTISSVFYRLSKFFLNNKAEKKITLDSIARLNVKCNSPMQQFVSLSGGNQQKVVLGKWLATEPRVIILDEPTRGIDANSRKEIYLTIRKLASSGIGVIVISSDFEEIVALSDRVIVMYNGRTVNELTGNEITLENITYASFGYAKEGARS